MTMKNIFKSAFVAAALSGLLIGCANNDEYTAPNGDCTDPGITANVDVATLDNAATNVPVQYTTPDAYIEGYVTSSDERGAFYKSISLQTMPTDGSAPIGFSVAIDELNLFGRGFYPGKKVYVKLQDLYYAVQDGSLKIGDLFEGTEVGRISNFTWEGKVVPSCDVVSEDMLVRNMTISEALNDDNINTLIELQGVQFIDAEVGQPYYDENNDLGGATNRTLTDAGGNQIIFRTSAFTNFSGNLIGGKSGKVRGVLTKFGSDFQFVARYESDIMLTEPRIDNAPPFVGNDLQFLGSFSENFESFANNNKQFPRYINDAAIGSRYWEVRSFGGNKYIQMSSFGGTPEQNRVLFIVPVDFSAANTFSFKTKGGFSNGPALKVYYSTNYVPGADINAATLTDITSQFTIDPGPASGYSTSFVNSGNWNIPGGLSGNGFVIFEYVGNGNGGVTTTVQIDDITVN